MTRRWPCVVAAVLLLNACSPYGVTGVLPEVDQGNSANIVIIRPPQMKAGVFDVSGNGSAEGAAVTYSGGGCSPQTPGPGQPRPGRVDHERVNRQAEQWTGSIE
jgi:hypothetical protein